VGSSFVRSFQLPRKETSRIQPEVLSLTWEIHRSCMCAFCRASTHAKRSPSTRQVQEPMIEVWEATTLARPHSPLRPCHLSTTSFQFRASSISYRCAATLYFTDVAYVGPSLRLLIIWAHLQIEVLALTIEVGGGFVVQFFPLFLEHLWINRDERLRASELQ
jgi:hypothetical protein